jgi:hypothetical protein
MQQVQRSPWLFNGEVGETAMPASVHAMIGIQDEPFQLDKSRQYFLIRLCA